MRVVITGASGLIGRFLSSRLADEGLDVVRVTRRPLEGFTAVGDYGDSPAGDVLVHLAQAGDRHWANTKGDDYETAALEVGRRLLRKDYGRVVYASSAALYGDRAQTARRVADPIHVTDTYTRVKFATEQAFLGKHGVVARFTNVYGPGMSEANVLSAVLRQLDSNGPISLRDLTPVRDFLWIGDAADALFRMVVQRPEGIFNVGTGVGTTVGGAVQTILNAIGQHARSIEPAERGTEPSHLVVDAAETTAAFGWRPQTPFAAGIRLLLGTRIQND